MRETSTFKKLMKLVFLVSFLLAIGSGTKAQLQFVIGQNSGSSTTYAYPTPFGNYYWGAHHQFVYRASELIAAGMPPGMISELAFNVTNVNGAVAHQGFTIGIKNSTTTDLLAWETGLTTVWGPVNYQPVAGWNVFPFASNFLWDGVSNIVVDVCFNNSSYIANALTQWTTGLTGTPCRYYNSDAAGVCANASGYASTSRTDIRFTLLSLTLDDAGISAINAPTSPSIPGLNDVNVTIKNWGTDTLTTATINHSIDGVLQPTYAWTGSLAQFATDGPVTINNYSFPFGSHQIKSWTTLPNGAPVDSSAWNDTTTVNVLFCNPLAGNYTIGGTGADFPDFTAAVDMLNSCGVNGPVKFFVADGTYTEQIKILQIPGGSAVNTVTFESASLDSSAVILQYTPTSAATNYTIWLNGADYVTFSKMTIKSFGNTALANVIVLNGNSCFNTFSHNRLIGVTPVAIADNYDMSVIYATKGGTSTDSMNVYRFNRIEYGYCGIYDYHTTGAEAGLEITNNYFFNQSRLATNLRYQKHPIITGNTIYSTMPSMYSASDMFGIHMVNCTYGFDITNNYIYLSNASTLNYGTAVNTCTATSTSRGVFANNMIVINSQVTTSANYGLHVGGNSTYPNSYFDVYHNSVNIYGGANASSRALSLISGGTATDVNIKNNIFVNKSNGYAMYLDYSTGFTSNYNNLFTTGTNLVYRTANFTTMALWQAASGTPDLNSLNINPMYFSNTNLHLSNAALNNVATPIATVLDDIDGEARNATTPDIGADEFTPPADDAGIHALVAPVNAAVEGTLTVTAGVTNFGLNTLTSVDVNWMVDGVLQTPFAWTGSIASGSNLGVDIGTYPFTLGVHTIKLWTSLPNGNVDIMTGNDTLTVSIFICGALNGAYSVGTPTSTFPTIQDVITVLNTCGVAGPVEFNIADGTYTGQYSLGAVLGASATNTITFQSASLDPALVTLQFTAPTSALNYVFKLDGADYIKLKYLTIKPMGASYAKGVVLMNAATYNTIDHCIFQGPVSTLTSNEMTNLFSPSGATLDAYNTVTYNTFLNNSYAMYFYASSSTVKEAGNVIQNNTFTNPYYYAMYMYYQDGLNVSNNTVTATSGTYTTFYNLYMYYPTAPVVIGNTFSLTSTSTSTCYGIYNYYSTGSFQIIRNNITFPCNGYGIYDYYNYSAQPTAANPAKVHNNMISIGGTGMVYGLYHYYLQNTQIYHNTVRTQGSTTYYTFYVSSTVTGTQVKNNVFANFGGGYAFYNSSATGLTTDYNNLYTSGTYLGYWAGAKANLTAWQLGSGQDAHSISMMPYFTSNYDLHTTFGAMGDQGTPLAAVVDDIDLEARSTTTPDMGADEFLPAPYEAALLGFATPTSGCGLSATSVVTLIIKNNGADVITPNMMSASYTVNGGTAVTEQVDATINPGQTVNYPMTTTADLSAPLNDLTFTITATVTLPGDAIATNNNASITVASGWVPPAPTGIDDTVSYAQMATLEAISPSSVWWYTGPVGGSTIYMGNPYVIGPLYDTVTYYAASVPSTLSDITVGTTGATAYSGTSSNPYGQYYTGVRNQYLFKASELAAAGIGAGPIYNIAFNVITPTPATIYGVTGNNLNNFTVKMGPTNLTAMTASYVSGLTTVFTAPSYITTTGWNTHAFSTPFVWDGESNIILETCFDNYVTGYSYSSDDANIYTVNTPFVSNVSYNSDGGGVCVITGGTTYSVRPQTRFNAFTAGCPSVHVPVTAVVQNIPANDAGIVAISSPASGIELCNELVTVTIQNWGFTPITNFQINYEVIETGTLVSEILQDTVYSGDILIHTFVTPADLCDFGTYTIVAYTSIPSDTYNVNDTTIISVDNDSITYCNPVPVYNCTSYYINNVTSVGAIQNIANPTTCNAPGYTYFPNQEIIVQPGMTFTVTVGLYSTYTGLNIWIDWNHNGDFTDAGEYVFNSYGYGSTGYTAVITVPMTATPGPQRMRVMAPYYYPTLSNDPCVVGNYGETEDYLFTINPIVDWDPGVMAITSPATTLDEGTVVPVKAILRNFGNLTLTEVPMYYTVNGGTPVPYTWTGSLTIGQTDTVNLGNMTVPGGNYTLCVYTDFALDMYIPNNQKCITLYGTPLYEAMMVEIVTPVSGCDLTTSPVTVTIKNIGILPINGGLTLGYFVDAGVPVLEQVSVIIPVDSIYTHTFVTPVNLAVPFETVFNVNAFLSLIGDPNLGDDTLDTDIISSVTPPLPIVPNQTVYTMATALLTPSNLLPGAGYHWYTVDTTFILTADTFMAGPILDTTTYLVRGGSGGASIAITEINIGAPDAIEITNLSNGSVNATGWKVVVSNDYSNINSVNATVWNLGVMAPGQVLYKTDGTTDNYWGSNLFWNPGAYPTYTGWAMIIDDAGDIVDFVAWGWPLANIQALSINVAGFPITVGDQWLSTGVVNPASDYIVRTTYDNNLNTDWVNQTSGSIGTMNPGLSSVGVGCQSAYASVTVYNVTPEWDIAVTAIPEPISGVMLTAAEPVSMTIYNNGLNAVTNLPVSFNVNGGAAVNEFVPVTIAPGATYTYTFTGTANLSTYTTYTITCSANLSGDLQAFNDSYSVTVGNSPPCTPTYTSGCGVGDMLTSFYFGSISLPSISCTGSYMNYTSTTYELITGIVLNLSGTVGFSSQYVTVWIDYNNNGLYESTEVIATNLNFASSGTTYTFPITIPANAPLGIHSMRVCDVYASNPTDPCGSYYYGATMDFTVNLVPDALIYLQGTAFNASCFGGADGHIELLTVNNGATPPYTYLWSNGATTENVEGLAVGVYCVTVNDAVGNVNDACFTITSPSQILSSLFVLSNASAYGAADGAIDHWVFNGTPPYTYEWYTGQVTEDLSGVTAGNYIVTVTDANGCEVTNSIYLTSPLPGGGIWNAPIQTAYTHNIEMQGNALITIDGADLVDGGLVGVFYDSLTFQRCAGYVFWNGTPVTMVAYGNNPNTPGPDGFAANETFKWKVVQVPAGLLGTGTACYDVTYPQQGNYFTTGLSGVSCVTAQTVVTQSIPIAATWGIWSTYIIPANLNMANVFHVGLGIYSSTLTVQEMNNIVKLKIQIVKNYSGQVYWPSINLNSIGNLNNAQGYQVKAVQVCTLNITGTQIQPQNYNLSMPLGWSLISYLRTVNGSTPTMLGTGTSNVVITGTLNGQSNGSIVPWIDIVKNGSGQVYWPSINLNSIGTMKPGQGYQIKMRSVNWTNTTTYTVVAPAISFPVTYKYPANTEAPAKDEFAGMAPVHYSFGMNTGSNMSLGIPVSAWAVRPNVGDEVAVVNAKGEVLGSGVFEGENMAFAVWGDDEMTNQSEGFGSGDELFFVLWNNLNGTEQTLTVSEWERGDEFYTRDGISLVKSIAAANSLNSLAQNIPNPASGTTSIGFSIATAGMVNITLYNLIGEKVTEIVNKAHEAGNFTIEVSTESLASGTYFYKMVTGDFVATRQMVVNK